MKRTILILVAAISGLLATAQDASRKETTDIYLTINYVYRVKDSVIIFFDNSKDLTFEKNHSAKALHYYMGSLPGNDDPRRMLKEVGSGFILSKDTVTYCFIKLYSSQDSIEKGDVISLRLSLPRIEKRSIFSTLAFNDILFTDFNQTPHYNQTKLFFQDNKIFEDSIYKNILSDLKNSYEQLKDRTDLSSVWYNKIAGGRFKDKTPLEVLRDANKNDLESFLLYAASYPLGYMSLNYRFILSFIGWATSNSPYSHMEIKNALFPIYENRELFRRQLQVYKTDILKENTVQSMIEEVFRLLDDAQFKEAEKLMDFILTLALEAEDTNGLPWAYIAMAQVKQDQEKYPEAIAACKKAIKSALISGDKEIEIQSRIKEAFCYLSISNLPVSDSLLFVTTDIINKYKPLITENVYAQNIVKIYEYRSTINKRTGDYTVAMSYLDSAIFINEKVNSLNAQLKNAGFYKIKGEIYNNQGKPADALEAFKDALEIYRNNIEINKWAKVLNEIANCRFSLGDYRQSIDDARTAAEKLLQTEDYDNAGYSLSIIGQSYWNLGNYDSAVISHKEAIGYKRRGNNISGVAWSWEKMGELYDLSGQKKSALSAYDSSAFYYGSISDSSGLGNIYNMKGNVYLKDESYKKAIEFFEKARGINSKTTVDGLFNLGMAWYDIDTTRSRNYFQESRNLSISTGNISQQFYSALNLAQLYYKSNNYVSGNRYYQECLELSNEIKTEESGAYSIALKGYFFEAKTDLDSALKYYTNAASVFSKMNKNQEVYKLISAFYVLISRGEFAKADETIIKAIDIATAASSQLALAEALAASSFLYGRTGEFSTGLTNSDNAVSIFTETGYNIRLANAFITRGALLSSMGEYRNAINTYLIADSIFKAELTNDSRSVVYNNIGVVYTSQKDYASALKNLDISLSMLPKGLVSESYLLTQGNRAECLYFLKKINESETLLLDVLPKAKQLKLHRIATGMAITLGTLYFEQNKPEKAIAHFRYALDYGNSSGEIEKSIEALKYLGMISLNNNRIDEAEKQLRQSLALVERFRTGIGWESYYELGMLYFNQQKTDSAIKYYKGAIELLEKNMENLYGGEEAKKLFDNDPRKADLYNKITFLLFNIGKTEEAWVYANRYNLAGIKELAGSLSLSSSQTEKYEALKKLFSMQQEQKVLRETVRKQQGEARLETLKKIEILEKDYNNFLQDMVLKYDDLETYFSRTNADEFYNYKSTLPEDVAVLLYMQNDKTLMIFSLTRENLSVDTMSVDPQELVNHFIRSIKDTKKSTGTGPLAVRSEPIDEESEYSGQEFRELSARLYDILINTVSDKIKSKKKLCIIPTGIYSNLPYQCLGKNMPQNIFRFLIEDHTIFYTNKMSIFKNEKPVTKNNFTSFAAFGVPDATLHYNIEEVKTLGKIIGIDSTIYTDERATESLAKLSLQQKKIIHFATHGVLNYSSDYSQSYLKLLPDKDTSDGNNGKLTMREIQKLGIRDCNMVILSACQTGVSEELVKGWSISPANSFLISNVRSVVASYWKVADEPTSLLMEYFYRNMKTMEKSEALRQAQIELSKDVRFVHPNYWGAFVLYGDWR